MSTVRLPGISEINLALRVPCYTCIVDCDNLWRNILHISLKKECMLCVCAFVCLSFFSIMCITSSFFLSLRSKILIIHIGVYVACHHFFPLWTMLMVLYYSYRYWLPFCDIVFKLGIYIFYAGRKTCSKWLCRLFLLKHIEHVMWSM